MLAIVPAANRSAPDPIQALPASPNSPKFEIPETAEVRTPPSRGSLSMDSKPIDFPKLDYPSHSHESGSSSSSR